MCEVSFKIEFVCFLLQFSRSFSMFLLSQEKLIRKTARNIHSICSRFKRNGYIKAMAAICTTVGHILNGHSIVGAVVITAFCAVFSHWTTGSAIQSAILPFH